MSNDAPSSTNHEYSLSALVDRFEGKSAVIRFQDGQELRWPIKTLPDDVHEGSAVRVTVTTSASDEEERARVARAMLNELLKRAE